MNIEKDAWERLRSLAREAAAPESLMNVRDAINIDSDEFEIRPGQIWSAEWNGENMCILTLASRSPSRCISVAPILMEPEAFERSGTVLKADETALGIPVTVWADLRLELPLKTLDHPLGSVTNDVLESILARSQSQRVEMTPIGHEPDTYGSDSPSTARWRAAIEDSLETLRGALRETDEGVTASASDVPVHEQPLGFKEVMQTLDVSQQQAMAVVRGKHPLSVDEARLLADETGRTLEQVQAITVPLPKEALIELDQPRWRTLIRDESRRRRLDDDDARLSLGYEAFGLAARQNGSGPEAWHQRFRTIARGRRRLDAEDG